MRDMEEFFGGPAEVGGLMPLFGATDNPTISGKEYLRSGIIKAIAGYSDLLTKLPGMIWNVGTLLGSGSAVGADAYVVHAGSTYYAFASGVTPKYSATLAAWAAVGNDSSTAPRDAFSFGVYAIEVTSGSCYYFSGSLGAAIAGISNRNCGAANAAGTLGVLCFMPTGVGSIHTSTDGVAWTSRTPSGGTAGGIYRAAWSIPAGAFIYLRSDGNAYTTADGYTLTAQGSCGVASVAIENLASRFNLSLADRNLFSVKGTYGGAANTCCLVKTLDGITYTAATWLSLTGISPASTPVISNVNGTLVAIIRFESKASDAGVVFTSADSGDTWTRAAVPMLAESPYSAKLANVQYLNASIVSVDSEGYLGIHASLAATHIGMPVARQVAGIAGTSTVTDYVRIK